MGYDVEYIEPVMYHFILENKKYYDSTKANFFTNETIRDIIPFVIDFCTTYEEVPTCEQVIHLLHSKKIDIKSDVLHSLYENDLNKYDKDWLKSITESWLKYKTFHNDLVEGISFFKKNKVNAKNVDYIIENTEKLIIKSKKIDFDFNIGLDFFDANSHIPIKSEKFSTGIDFIDKTSGGLRTKSLVTFIGQPKVGKSLFLGNIASSIVKSGNNVCLITCEVGDRDYVKRLGSNLFNIASLDYENFTNDLTNVKNKIQKLKEIDTVSFTLPGQFIIKEYPMSTLTIPQLENYLLETEGVLGIKFKAVVVDYLNIMANNRSVNSENLYVKIKHISEDLRAIGQKNNWCMISATQTNRSGLNASDIMIESVSESAAVLHTVDLMYGIIQDPIMKANCEYFLKVLLNRHEGFINHKKKFLVEYKYMRIWEDPNTDIISDI